MPVRILRAVLRPRVCGSYAGKLYGTSILWGTYPCLCFVILLIFVQINCISPVLLDLGCSLSNLTALGSCLCLNIQAESKIADCVVRNCTYTELVKVEKVQYELCHDEPKPSRSASILAVTITLAVLVITFVALRCWSRHTVSKEFWWDDWFLLFSTSLFLALQGANIWGVKMGFGVHVWNVNPDLNVKLYQVSGIYILP